MFCVFLKKEKCAGTPNYYTTDILGDSMVKHING